MGAEDDNANINGIPKWLVAAALLSGSANGIVGLSSDTSDRFKRAEFDTEIAQRDSRIRELEREQHKHLQHSAKYSQIIEDIRLRFREHTKTHGE